MLLYRNNLPQRPPQYRTSTRASIEAMPENEEDLIKKVLQTQEEACEPKAADVAIYVNYPVYVDYSQGRWEEAVEKQLETVRNSTAAQGIPSAIKIHERHILGILQLATEDNTSAEENLLSVLHSRMQNYWPIDPKLVMTCADIGLALLVQGKYAEAEHIIQKACQDIGILPNLEAITILNSLGSALKSQGKYQEAEQIFSQAFERRKQVPGFCYRVAVMSALGLRSVLNCLKKHDEAEAVEKQFGIPHALPSVSQQWCLLGKEHYTGFPPKLRNDNSNTFETVSVLRNAGPQKSRPPLPILESPLPLPYVRCRLKYSSAQFPFQQWLDSEYGRDSPSFS
ncbi:uncharacterized protein PADG_06464 [Paracoccidioides brasiliensis Pb18]|uniref:Uncharacterized protein n=1 Tax=Paracoccidioides brasiliensis (strain Pb18) TaxID=502780 RepID=C1GGM7_PARBD|nr:uncharacterized protein PADG_06464 [Paracoccidioides brasiliensis Pb18]EEH50385.2 hypothetical protein PADG_06464 [Paracoccidioides brasiliensis Pb18]